MAMHVLARENNDDLCMEVWLREVDVGLPDACHLCPMEGCEIVYEAVAENSDR